MKYIIISVLKEVDSFSYRFSSRKFSSFQNKTPILDIIDKDDKIVDWMVDKVAPLVFNK